MDDLTNFVPQPDYARWLHPNRYLEILKDPQFALLMRLQHAVSEATFGYWGTRKVITLHLPITTHAVSSPMGLGSDSKPVEIDLNGERTFLADSMQFMLEFGCRLHKSGCFYLMPSFRGEHADETHLCQFYHSEVELPCDLHGAMDASDSYFRFLCERILGEFASELAVRGSGTRHIEQVLGGGEFPRISFDEAAGRLGSDPQYIRQESAWRSLTRAGERELLTQFGGPLWVYHWDHLAVPFYQAFAGDERTARNADFLLGFGEVIGLGERHSNSAETLDALKLHGVNAEPYDWYLRLKDAEPLGTSGFGMGVERFLMWVLNHKDIRDLQLLPRFNGFSVIP